MSETFDLDDQIGRIRRARELVQKSVAEQRALMAEQGKLLADLRILQRNRLLSPWFLVAVLAGAVGGVIAGLAAIIYLARLV